MIKKSPAPAFTASMQAIDRAWKMLIFLGMAVCVIGPVFFTMIIWMTQFWVHSDATDLLVTFAWCCGIGIPLLFFLEHITRGMFYDGPDAASPDSMGGDGEAANRSGSFTLMIEISLWGRRIVMTGFKRFIAESKFKRDARKPSRHKSSRPSCAAKTAA